jgi:hypothetical protein
VSRLALALAAAALVAAGCASPGLYAALGLGVAAIGTGWVAYRRRGSPGASRLAGAAAVTLGLTGVLLGALRVALTLAAIGHLDRMLGA